MLRIAFEVKSDDCVGQDLVVVPAFKLVNIILSNVEAFFDWLFCLFLHPIILFPDGFVACAFTADSIDKLTAIGTNVILDVIVIELCQRHLNKGIRQGHVSKLMVNPVSVADIKGRGTLRCGHEVELGLC